VRPVLSSVQFLRGPPTLTPPPSQRTAPLPSVRPTIKGTKLFLLSFLHLCRFPSMEIRVPVSPSPRGAKKAWKPSRRVPRYHIWCGRRLHISSAGVAAWKGCGYSMRISSSSTAHPCPFLGLTLAPAHDTSVSDIWARRNDAALDAAQPAYNTRPTAPGKAASSNSPAPTCSHG